MQAVLGTRVYIPCMLYVISRLQILELHIISEGVDVWKAC